MLAQEKSLKTYPTTAE
ncbi:hypothetical protein L195_g039080, partial [Trifolium pratense]